MHVWNGFSDMDKSLEDIESVIISSQGRIVRLEKSLQDRSEISEISRVTGMVNPVADGIKQRLIDLRFSELELANRYHDESRVLIELREQIRFAEDELLKEQATKTELTTGIDANYQVLQLELEQEQAQLQALIAQKQYLKKSMEKRKKDLIALNNNEAALSTLQREVDIARDEYNQYRESYQRVKISMALDVGKISNVNILQPATLPIEPIKSKKRRNLALGFLLGLIGSVCIAYAREHLDNTIKTVDDVNKQLGLPVLITIDYKKLK